MDQSFEDAAPRIYTLKRDPNFGYGFIIGHEYPTMVKLVKPNGPSYRLLSQGDVIMSINGIDVETASRDSIIRMINLNSDKIEIKVRQPAYKELIKSQKVMEIYKNVIRVFFESGDTKLLNYGPNTTVGSVLESLNARITNDRIKSYFGLALTLGVNEENAQNDHLPKRKLLHILDENDSIMKIRQLPYANRLRLVYRMVEPPTDVCALYKQDKVAFNYLYNQSCNDLKFERFNPELSSEIALKMTALYLIEYVHTNHSKSIGNSKDPKSYIKLIKKEPKLEFFLSASSIATFTDKKGKKIPGNFKKMKIKLMEHLKNIFDEIDLEPMRVKSTTSTNPFTSFHEISLPGIQSSTSDYIKLLFLTYLSEFPCYCNFKRSNQTYSQRDTPTEKSIEELLRRVTLLPPPPPPPPDSSIFMGDMYLNQTLDRNHNFPSNGRMTQVLTDMDIEMLRVPPPPPPLLFDC